jgi:hypothetical protein
MLLVVISFPLQASAVSYPVTSPAWEQQGGWFQTYFDNMYINPCPTGEFLNWFSLSWTLLCFVPWLAIAGSLGQTLYHNWTEWVVSSNLWNNDTNVGIWTATPWAKLDVNGDALINSLSIGRWSGSIASNSAFWYQSLFSNQTGINNVGIWYQSLYSNVSGYWNSALGYRALRNSTGDNNSSFGFESLYSNITGSNNTAYWVNSLYLNTIGSSNTAIGYNALSTLTSGDNNIAIGYNAEVPSSSWSGQLSIWNWIYGSGGAIGIGTGLLNSAARLKVAGQIEITWWSPGVWKVLSSDANGLATWTGIVAATSLTLSWSAPGSTIYFDGTDWVPSVNIFNNWWNIGIGGIILPSEKLHVLWNIAVTGQLKSTSTSWHFDPTAGVANFSNGYFDNLYWSDGALRLVAWAGVTYFATWAGNIGIWTATPWAELEVNGQVKITWGNVASGRILTSDASGLATWQDPGVASSMSASGITGWASWYLTVFGSWWNGINSSLFFQTWWRIGLWTSNPATTLDIVGQVKISGGTPGTGKVLTSDISGLAFWWDPAIANSVYATGVLASASSGGYITQFMPSGSGITNSIIFQSGWYIGIWNTNPLYGLDVTGTFRTTSNAVIGGTIQISWGTPWIWKFLTSDASGNASWSAVTASTVYATWVLGSAWSGGYLTRFMTNGSGITSSLAFESGSRIGIWNTNPWYNLDVTGTFRNTGNATIGGNTAITWNSTVGWTLGVTGITTLWSTLNVTGASNLSNTLAVWGATSLQSTLSVSGNTLLAWTIQIQWGTPGLGKILMSDANGLASWTTYASGSTATGITGGASGYLSVFWTWWNGLYSSLLFQSGSRIGIWNTNPWYTLDVTGTWNFVWLRLPTWAASNYILTSDASGNARWLANNYVETDPQVGTNTTNYLSKWDGSALVTSQIFDNSTNVGIWTAVPWSYRLNVNWDTYIAGDITVSGSVITDKIVNRTVTNVSISWSLMPDASAPLVYRDIWSNGSRWNNLYLSWQIKIWGGTPGLGKILMSDANGLASWTTYASGSTATGITGGASGYLSVFWTWWNGLYSSLLFQSGSRIGIWNTNPWYTLDVTGTWNFVWLRLPTWAASNYILTSDASGNARWTNSAPTVYATWVLGSAWSGGYLTRFMTNGSGITSSLVFETGWRIWIWTIVPQYMVDIRGSGSILNAGSGLCIDGTCINAWSGLNDIVKSQWTPNYIAKFNSGWIIDNSQIYETGGKLYIWDIPGIIGGAATVGYVTIESPSSTNSSNPFLTLSENGWQECRMWITGANKLGSNCSWAWWTSGFSYEPNQLIRADGAWTDLTGATLYQVGNYFWIWNSSPLSRFEVWTGSAVSPLQHFRWTQNIWLGQNWLNIAVSWSRNVWIGTYALSGVTSGSRNIGIGSLAGSNITTGSNNIMIGSGTQIATATWSDQLNIGNWIYGSGGKIWIGTGSLSTTAILKVAGQIEITWGSPGLGKLLMSDANGLATWTSSISWATATWIVGWVQNYVPKFWTGWTWLYVSQIVDTWTGIWIGATWSAITTKVVIDSWIDDDSWLRLSRLDLSTPLTSNWVLALWVNASWKLLPISPISNIAVYTGVLRTTALVPNPDLNTFNITYNYNQYFAIPGKQSFVVSKWDGPSYNGPYFKENGTSPLCSITGTYWSSPYDCADPDPVTWISASPYNSFTMSAKGDTFWYQLALWARWDAPLFARSGRFNWSQTGWLYTNDSPYQTPAPWQRVLSVPANHPEYLYINTWLNSQLQAQAGWWNVWIWTTFPDSRFEIWTGATTTSLMHFRWTENVWLGLNSLNTSVTWRRNIALWVNGLDIVTSGSYNIAIGSNAWNTLTTGSWNIMIGSWVIVSATGANQLNIGNWIYGSGWKIAIWASNPTSQFEVWSGSNVMLHFRGGNNNIGFGLNATRHQATGTANSAFGDDALRTDTTGYSNTALGYASLYSNQTWFFNTAWGTQSLYTNSDGTWNIALGSQSLYTNLSWDNNVAIGWQAVYLNSSGNDNIGIGYQALRATTNGTNIGIGTMAGSGITTGTNNIMIGDKVQAFSNTRSDQLNIGDWIYGSGGNIGIGVADPDAKFEVNGQVKITGGSPGAGKVLTSDANGLATWQTPSGSGGWGGWVTGGQSDYSARWIDATTLGTGALTDDGTNVGVGTASPWAKFGVNGTFRLGTNGTQLNAIIKVTVNKDISNISNNGCSAETFTVTNALTTWTAIISPASALTNGLFIAYSRVSTAGTVEVKFCNESGASINMGAMNYYITVIQ